MVTHAAILIQAMADSNEHEYNLTTDGSVCYVNDMVRVISLMISMMSGSYTNFIHSATSSHRMAVCH
jgi:hypothetical protein